MNWIGCRVLRSEQTAKARDKIVDLFLDEKKHVTAKPLYGLYLASYLIYI